MHSATAMLENAVKKSYFRHLFNTKYNLSFRSPRTDVCSMSSEFSEKLKHVTHANVKNTLMIQSRLHKFKTKAFYDKLKEQRGFNHSFL